MGVDLILVLDLVQDRQRALAVSGVGFPRVLLRLRKDDEERKGLGVFLDDRSQSGRRRLAAIVPRLVVTVEKLD